MNVLVTGGADFIGSGLVRSLVNDLLADRVGSVFAPARPGNVRVSQAAVDKADGLMGQRPLAPVLEGVAATVHWFADSSIPSKGALPR
jgi:nucleoside-diphosphate-sugar epimerase